MIYSMLIKVTIIRVKNNVGLYHAYYNLLPHAGSSLFQFLGFYLNICYRIMCSSSLNMPESLITGHITSKASTKIIRQVDKHYTTART